MLQKNFIQFCKILLLALVLLMEFGCSSMSAKSEKESPNRPDASINTVETVKQLPNDDKNSVNKKNLKKEYGYRKGDRYLEQYQKHSLVKQIILVEQSATEVSTGLLFLLSRGANDEWQELLRCKVFLGKNGIDKVREGDARTPTGDFGMLMAFGAKDDPGTLMPYTKLTNTMYLCGDKEYYNQFIDISKVKHNCSNNSEHLIRYIPQYNYALFFDYNKENVYGKGSAIFLHCAGNNPYTLGCVSVAEDNIIKILKTVDMNARICIYAGK